MKQSKNRNNPKMLITKEVMSQILYLNSKVCQNEWSGVLFYEIEGNKIEDLKITTKYILPMDEGSHAYTEFEDWTQLIEVYKERPELENLNMGLIHSHNTMAVFFSGTDTKELKENSKNHNFYLSLIVNNNLDAKAKIGVTIDAVAKGKILVKNVEQNIEYNTTIYKEYDVEIEKEFPVDSLFLKYFNKIRKKNLESNKKYEKLFGYNIPYSNNNNIITTKSNSEDTRIAREVAARAVGISYNLDEETIWEEFKKKLNLSFSEKDFEEFGDKIFMASNTTEANNPNVYNFDAIEMFFKWAENKAKNYTLKKLKKLRNYV